MTRQTDKFIKALTISGQSSNTPHQIVYQFLAERGFYWDSTSKQWIFTDPEQNDPPSSLYKIRVWAATEEVEAIAQAVIVGLHQQGYQLSEKSIPYICRPPKANESRIYLSFFLPSISNSSSQPTQPSQSNQLGQFNQPRPGDMVLGNKSNN